MTTLLLLQIFLVILLSLLALLVAFFVAFEAYTVFISAIKGAPFVPSARKKIETMIALADLSPADRAMDLGSGHGVIVIEAAQKGASATGIEMNPFLVFYSRQLIKRRKLENRARIIKEDLRSYPLEDATVIFLYLMPQTIELLRPRFEKELKPGTRIISNTFAIAGWTPEKTENNVYSYIIR